MNVHWGLGEPKLPRCRLLPNSIEVPARGDATFVSECSFQAPPVDLLLLGAVMLDKCICGSSSPNFITPFDPYLAPRYTLEPLAVRNWLLRGSLSSQDSMVKTIAPRYVLFSSARAALAATVGAMTLSGGTDPFVATTSDSVYLSNCIPQVLGKISRHEPEKSEVKIFAADFGFKTDKPLNDFQIYDDAWSLDLAFASEFVEHRGRVYISSLPKVFGFPFGGLAILSEDMDLVSDLSDGHQEILNMMVGAMVPQVEEIRAARLHNLKHIYDNLQPWRPKFDAGATVMPGAAVIKPNFPFDERDFKARINAHGVRSTAFFGNQGVLVPVHQRLARLDLEYLSNLTRHCLQESSLHPNPDSP